MEPGLGLGIDLMSGRATPSQGDMLPPRLGPDTSQRQPLLYPIEVHPQVPLPLEAIQMEMNRFAEQTNRQVVGLAEQVAQLAMHMQTLGQVL